MQQIIPALLTKTQEEFETRLRIAEKLSDIVQIDILDNTFVPFESWADPTVIKGIQTSAQLELHLMVNDVEKHIKTWAQVPHVKRIIFHYEPYAEKEMDAHDILGTAAFYGWETGIAINPETPETVLDSFAKKINVALFLGVNPGQSGQAFEDSIVEKIKRFKKKHKKITVAVDGGVSEKTIPALKDAGVDLFDASSAIFNSSNPSKTFSSLENLF